MAGLLNNFSDFYGGILQRLRGWDADKRRIVTEIALQALSDAITLSPVDTGRYRASHDLTMNEPSGHTPAALKRQASDKSKQALTSADQTQAAIAELSAIDFKRRGSFSIFLTTNLVYASALEFGHSKQAPGGIYAIVKMRALNNLQSEGLA